MSATLRQRITSDSAAHELWRVAETGDVDELGRILRGADVNARNKHGMTALMRAAYHGHEQMVRALLEHRADPNLARNDKFTALALAAFFGHTETVRILIEHGAKTEIITRCGASAKTWATARTFDEAARCLDSHAPTPVPAPAPPAPAPAVKTLKDPPEIWDLVQEVPRGFNARSAFVSRLKSMKTSLALGIAAVAVLSAACVVGALVLRGSQARSLPAEPASNQRAADDKVSTPVNAETSARETTVSSASPEVAGFSHHSESYDANSKLARKVLRQPSPKSRSNPVEEPVAIVQSREVPAPAPTVATPQVEPRNTSRPGTSLSPQLIAPAKSAPPKAKVIQWP